MRTRIAGIRFGRYKSRSSVGKEKAAVCVTKQTQLSIIQKQNQIISPNKQCTFPEPVIALPHISRPVNAKGIHAAYQKKQYNRYKY